MYNTDVAMEPEKKIIQERDCWMMEKLYQGPPKNYWNVSYITI